MAARSIRRSRAHKRSMILVIIVTVILSVILSIAIVRLNRENRQLLSVSKALDESISAEESVKAMLEEKEGRGLTKEEAEQIARDRYNLVYPDEIILTPEE